MVTTIAKQGHYPQTSALDLLRSKSNREADDSPDKAHAAQVKQPVRQSSSGDNVLIIAEYTDAERPHHVLAEAGYNTSLLPHWDEALSTLKNDAAALVVVTLDRKAAQLQELTGWMRQVRAIRDTPVLAAFPEEILNPRDIPWDLDDFILEPYESKELLLRVERLLGAPALSGHNAIVCDDLVMDLEQYRVSVAGRPVYLTFKEFQLMKFLASQPGKVFNREVLLNEVWGYDFFGGGRTVDVHIRHLRSKIEDKDHSFIHTVRNIGYYFEA